MIKVSSFFYEPSEHECERASNSYVMSLVAIVAGLPMPIVNLIATFFFFMANRRAPYFVRWHCRQALYSQLSLLVMNTVAVWWTISLFYYSISPTAIYFAYITTVVIYNVAEFAATIYTAIQTRKGIHVEWLFYGTLTNQTCNDHE